MGKLIDPLWEFAGDMAHAVAIDETEYGFKINLVLHTVGMIERIILNEPLTVEENELKDMLTDEYYLLVEEQLNNLEYQIKVKTPPAEVYFLVKLIHNHLEKNEYTNL